MLADTIAEQTFVAFDLETTGIQVAVHGIVEIGAVKFTWQDGIISTYETLVDPQRSIPAEVIAVHGITEEMVQGKPPIQGCLPDFLAFIDQTVLLAHNAPFDLGFLSYALNQHQINKPNNMVIDTCTLARTLLPQAPNHKLQTLVRSLNLEMRTAHRALADSLACSEVFKACINQLPLRELSPMENLFAQSPKARSAFWGPEKPAVELEPFTEAIAKAIASQQDLRIEYHNARNERLSRQVTPIYLGGFGQHIYLEAFCHLRQARRHFRLDRIQEINVH